MKHQHTYSFSEDSSLLTLTFVDDLTLEDAVDFLTVVVTHRLFPDRILILQDHSKAKFKLTLTDLHMLEAFQRKYIDAFEEVRLAIINSEDAEFYLLSKYYSEIINNKNCTISLAQNKADALKWLQEAPELE